VDLVRRVIEFWFDFSSPYGYFASETIEQFAAETGRTIVWRPFLLGVLFPKTNMAPLIQMPIRGDYARRDCDRIARLLGIPFCLPASHPYSAVKASRAYYWLEANRPDQAVAFAHAIFRAHFAKGDDPSETSVITDIANELNLSATELLNAIQDEAMKAELKRRVDEAVAKSVFGSPFFIVDGEPFWGWDRMQMMRQWIERGGW
jgi:2-hydroxychromene-2-carboxylate isomerase